MILERRRNELTAIIGHDAKYVVVAAFVIERFRVAYDSVHIDDERLVAGEYLVFAYVTEFRGAIAIGRLHSDDFGVDTAFVHLTDVTGFGEARCVFVYVRHGYVHRGTETQTEICFTDYFETSLLILWYGTE